MALPFWYMTPLKSVDKFVIFNPILVEGGGGQIVDFFNSSVRKHSITTKLLDMLQLPIAQLFRKFH